MKKNVKKVKLNGDTERAFWAYLKTKLSEKEYIKLYDEFGKPSLEETEKILKKCGIKL